jgi:hypothetical protein
MAGKYRLPARNFERNGMTFADLMQAVSPASQNSFYREQRKRNETALRAPPSNL